MIYDHAILLLNADVLSCLPVNKLEGKKERKKIPHLKLKLIINDSHDG